MTTKRSKNSQFEGRLAAALPGARSMQTALPRERAVLVAVEFTGERRRIPATAMQARTAASIGDDDDELIGVEDGSFGGSEDGATSSKMRAPVAGGLDFESALEEFQELARSAGAEIADTLIQHRQKPDAATLIGPGKVEELVALVAATGADVVLFDHDLTPSQLRNLDKELPCRVIDRTQLILDIFARHARTREGQLQVELAQLEYQLPRLAGQGKSMSQLGGGIGTRGPGETKLETDRRRIRQRIDHVKVQLEQVRRIRRQQRQRRESVPVPTVALVGYTNAGKSTLFNVLTDAGVLESDRMFATLDPKLRLLALPSRRKVLLSDTVGFIRNLPHTLVTSFRATLEEVERAQILVHVRDASSPMMDEQKAQVEAVLSELETAGKPVIEVLNKIDLLPEEEQGLMLAANLGNSTVVAGRPQRVAISAHSGIGIDDLIRLIDERIGGSEAEDPTAEATFLIPQREGRTLAALEAGAFIEHKRFEGSLVHLVARGPMSLLSRYRRFQEADVLAPETSPEARPRVRTRPAVEQK